MEKKFIFVAQLLETEELFAGRKVDIDGLIRQYEADGDLPFTTIAKIQEPPGGLPIGFNSQLIEWYDKKLILTKELLDEAVLAIIELIR